MVELEDLGKEGKRLRGAIALASGRTSMPSIWVGGRCIGGYTDGDMALAKEPALCYLDSPGLEEMVRSGRFNALAKHLGESETHGC